jgi:flagellar protein FlbD
MIILSKLDQSPLLVNLDAIKFIETTPDTLIFFQNGDTTFVRESLSEIIERVIEYKSRVLRNAAQTPNSDPLNANKSE